MEMYQTTPPQSDLPMDEFESKGGSRGLKPGNIIKVVKLLVIVLIVCGIGIGLFLGIKSYMAGRNTTVVVKKTPSPTSSATPKPQKRYPDEYNTLDEMIDDYDRNTSNIPEKRSRLEYPQLNPDVSF